MRKDFKVLSCLVCLVFCMVIAAAPAYAADAVSGASEHAEGAWPKRLTLLTGPAGGNWAALGAPLGKLWSQKVVPIVVKDGGGVSNIIGMPQKKGSLGFTTTSLLGAAIKGEGEFRGKSIEGVTVMANLYEQYTYFIMRKDYAQKNNIKTIADIAKKKLPLRFATLSPGTASEFMVNALLLKGYNINYNSDFKKWGGGGFVTHTTYEEGAALLQAGKIDCIAFCLSKSAAIIKAIEAKTEIVILPVDDKAIKALGQAYGTVSLTIEPKTYKSVTKPIKTVGDYACTIATRPLPDDLVYALCKTLWENKANLSKTVKDMAELNIAAALPAKLPVHPGAAKFWKEVKK